ncbi:WD40 repeat-like protein [Trametopsis cervina]|nr:WD40 repeat-like protein [Trametopsis cervina]
MNTQSIKEREDYILRLLETLPRSSIAHIRRRMAPLLKVDIVGLLPDEVSLLIFSYLPWKSLLACSVVNWRWRTLAHDPSLWRWLCKDNEWEWRDSPAVTYHPPLGGEYDDEGMGEEEEDIMVEHMLLEDSGFASMMIDSPAYPAPLASTSSSALASSSRNPQTAPSKRSLYPQASSSSSAAAPAASLPTHTAPLLKPDYKLLFKTHILLQTRFRHKKYTLRTLQSRGTPTGHTNTIYCLQLYTYPSTSRQVLFTGSRDRTIREWDLWSGSVVRVFQGRHEGSVLSVCARDGLLASGGSDGRVVVWELGTGAVRTVVRDHSDSVLCVRFDGVRLVTCSKDRTIRTYTLPDFTAHLVLDDHRAAVNAVAVSDDLIVSGSGDRSMKLWDATTGELLQSHENHHGRGLAAIDFSPPYVLSGSSDKHMKLTDLSSGLGWCTSPDPDPEPCDACGSLPRPPLTSGSSPTTSMQTVQRQVTHADLVRSVALNGGFVVSGSYDHTVKIWDRESGKLLADLSDGHTGRIFCVGFDHAKIVSCGEDQRICVWDFSEGIDTSFVKL